MQAWQATVQDDRGNALPNPVVTVYESDGTTEADIFNEAGTALPNPLTGDIDGFVQFYARPGKYKVDAGGGTVWDVYFKGPVTPSDFGAVGNGVADDRAAFVEANVTGSLIYVDPPSVRYEFSSPYRMTGALPDLDPTATWSSMTDSGALTWGYGDGFRDQAFVPVHRFPGRSFFGAESNHSANRFGVNGYGDSPIAQHIASYIIKNAAVGATHDSPRGRIGLAGGCWIQPDNPGNSAIAVAGIARHDGNGGGARGGYFEVVMASTTAGLASTAGEFQVGNHTPFDPIISAYNMVQSVVNGIQVAPESQDQYTTGNGDTLYPEPLYPCGAGIDISGGGTDAAYKKWTCGIVFRNGALRRDGSGNAVAMRMAMRHQFIWEAASGTPGAMISSHVTTSAGYDQRLIFVNGGIEHRNNTGLAIHSLTAPDNAANGLRFDGVLAGSGVFIRSQGSDANIDINMRPKGTTSVVSIQRPSFTGVPTSATGLSAGMVWSDGGILRIV